MHTFSIVQLLKQIAQICMFHFRRGGDGGVWGRSDGAFPAHARNSGLLLQNALETARGHNSPRVEEIATDSRDMHTFLNVQLQKRLSVYQY